MPIINPIFINSMLALSLLIAAFVYGHGLRRYAAALAGSAILGWTLMLISQHKEIEWLLVPAALLLLAWGVLNWNITHMMRKYELGPWAPKESTD